MNFNKITIVAGHHWDIHLISYSNSSHRRAFIHQSPYVSQNYNLSLHPSFTYGYKDFFEVTPEWELNEQYGHYSAQAIADQQNFRQCIGLSTLLNYPWRIRWENDLSYVYNSHIAPGFRKNLWLCNITFDFALFKDKQGCLQFSVYALLNQNVNVQRDISDIKY